MRNSYLSCLCPAVLQHDGFNVSVMVDGYWDDIIDKHIYVWSHILTWSTVTYKGIPAGFDVDLFTRKACTVPSTTLLSSKWGSPVVLIISVSFSKKFKVSLSFPYHGSSLCRFFGKRFLLEDAMIYLYYFHYFCQGFLNLNKLVCSLNSRTRSTFRTKYIYYYLR